jgi:hypothetical protein
LIFLYKYFLIVYLSGFFWGNDTKLQPLQFASNNFIWKYFWNVRDMNWKTLTFSQKYMKYNEETLIWEGPSPSAIPEFLGSGSKTLSFWFSDSLLSELKKLKILGWKMAKKLGTDNQTNGQDERIRCYKH